MEKFNPDKLESLVWLAARRGWEVTVVPECCPTSQALRQQAVPTYRHWKWEGWELVHTGKVGVLLNPVWSAAWHSLGAPKHRSASGRVVTLILPRDPAESEVSRAQAWLVSGVWAPVSTSSSEDIEEFWDDVAAVSRCEVTFTPQASPLIRRVDVSIPQVIAGDFNAQLFEPEPTEDEPPAGILGRFRPPCRHQLDELAFNKVLALGDWVHADSFRPAIGNRHRCTWYSAIHKQWYELDWMLVPRRHLSRVASMTLRHVTDPLQTQHSAKEYLFRLEQSGRRPRPTGVRTRPDLQALRGNSDAAREARVTLAAKVKEELAARPESTAVAFADFRQIVARHTLQVCGPVQRSCRKPWLRTREAQAQLAPLANRCTVIRRQKRALTSSGQERAPEVDAQIEELRQEHNQLKKRQRQLQRELEKSHWEEVLASHPRQEADSFRFFRTLRCIQQGGKVKTAQQNPFGPADWKDHFSQISSEAEFITSEIRDFVDAMPVSPALREVSARLDDDLSSEEIRTAVRTLRAGAGGGDDVPPVVLKALFADRSLAQDIERFVRELWATPAAEWEPRGLDGPGLQVPLWKQKEPFNSMDTWRGVVLLWVVPRVLAKIVNARGQSWFEQSALPLPESFGFRRGLGTDDALFMVRRLNEEISAWQSFGWQGACYEAGLMDLRKAYPTANKLPFWHILAHHGVSPEGPFTNALRGFHCHRHYKVRTGPSPTPASLSEPYKPTRGFGEGDGTSPWAWNVLYSAVVRFAQQKRREHAAARGLPCGIPWRWTSDLHLSSNWTRKADDRPVQHLTVDTTIFADDTTLHGLRQELHEAELGHPSGMDAFSAAVGVWGSAEHAGKREKFVYGSNENVCLVGGGLGPEEAVNRNIRRGIACWSKLRPALKGSRLSLKVLGRLLMTFVYSPLAYSGKTRSTRKRDYVRMQAVLNTASRYVCRTRLRTMNEKGINHNDLRAKLEIPPVQAALERDQMRWLGHVARMRVNDPRAHARKFARGTIDVGRFQKTHSRSGGRITADRKSLPDRWVELCHRHGFQEDEVHQKASDRQAWECLIQKALDQAMFQDRQESHHHKNTLVDPGLAPWVRQEGRRPPSPEAHERRLQLQRERRAAAARADPPAAPKRAAAAAPAVPQPKHQPRQIQRAQASKTYYAGHNQRRVTAAERAQWPFACEVAGCGLRFETERALKIHVSKANKPGGTHTLL